MKYYKKTFPAKRDLWVKKVSRTFALSIKILPGDLRAYIGHSYLICRLLDSLEDAPDLPVSRKHEALDIAKEAINSPDALKKSSSYLAELAAQSDIAPWEKELLIHSEELFQCLETFPRDIRKSIRTWTCEMADGMKKYAFGIDKPEVQLASLHELDDYTYYVAGTVGKLLSEMFGREKYKIPAAQLEIMDKNAISFGKGLQLVNIIKDSRADIEDGRCFLPKELFDKYETSIEAFLQVRDHAKIKGIFKELIGNAETHLKNAISYINVIPGARWRIRLGCIWPVVLAYKTLWGLERNLDQFIKGSSTFKIKKKEVKGVLLSSLWAGVSNRYFNRYLKKIEKERKPVVT